MKEVVPHQVVIHIDTRAYEMTASGECKVPAVIMNKSKVLAVFADSKEEAKKKIDEIMEFLKNVTSGS